MRTSPGKKEGEW